MPKGPQGEKRPADSAAAAMVAKIATGEIEQSFKTSPGKVRSGKDDANARARKPTAEERLVSSGEGRIEALKKSARQCGAKSLYKKAPNRYA